jgi:hypothetical protein
LVVEGPRQVSFASPFSVALMMAVASIVLIGLMELLPDRRLAVVAVVVMAVACGIVSCTIVPSFDLVQSSVMTFR